MALWAEGEDISLTLSAKNGQAKIRLELDIGEIETIRSFNPSYDAVNHPGEVYANSRQRQRDRRLKERDIIKTVDQAVEAVSDIENHIEDGAHMDTTENVNSIKAENAENLDVIGVPVVNDIADTLLTGNNELENVISSSIDAVCNTENHDPKSQDTLVDSINEINECNNR